MDDLAKHRLKTWPLLLMIPVAMPSIVILILVAICAWPIVWVHDKITGDRRKKDDERTE